MQAINFKDYDVVVFIGRFNPLHKGHEIVIDEALKRGKKVILMLGSAFIPRTLRDFLTFEERKELIRMVFPEDNLIILPVRDYMYNDTKWVNAIQRAVKANSSPGDKIALIGHSKDSSSYYLKIFPQWDSINVPNIGNYNATDIRKAMLNDTDWANLPVSDDVYFYLREFTKSDAFRELLDEHKMVEQYKKSWEAAPYPPTFVTVDSVVTVSGHILLVERKARPGKGLWALPGGFIDKDETLVDSAIRELREETKLKVPSPVLKGSIKDKNTFDAPNRSSRGRTITTAFHIDLGFEKTLPKVKGGDDAKDAKWVPINEVDSRVMFEDHASIIDYFLDIMD